MHFREGKLVDHECCWRLGLFLPYVLASIHSRLPYNPPQSENWFKVSLLEGPPPHVYEDRPIYPGSTVPDRWIFSKASMAFEKTAGALKKHPALSPAPLGSEDNALPGQSVRHPKWKQLKPAVVWLNFDNEHGGQLPWNSCSKAESLSYDQTTLIMWMDKILHHFETIANHCPSVLTGE